MKRQKRVHRMLWLAVAGIALQAMVPAGYMPAPLADGLPFVLCPGGFSGGTFAIAGDGAAGEPMHDRMPLHDHAGNDPQGDAASVTWEFCPFGAVLGGASPVAEYITPPSTLEQISPHTEEHRVLRSALTRSWRARAPPTYQPIDV